MPKLHRTVRQIGTFSMRRTPFTPAGKKCVAGKGCDRELAFGDSLNLSGTRRNSILEERFRELDVFGNSTDTYPVPGTCPVHEESFQEFSLYRPARLPATTLSIWQRRSCVRN